MGRTPCSPWSSSNGASPGSAWRTNMNVSDLPRADRYAYLNRVPSWGGFELDGLERMADGTLGLTRAPQPVATLGPASDPALAPADSRPAGVAESHGDVYTSDPAGHRVSRINPCLSQPEDLPYTGGR